MLLTLPSLPPSLLRKKRKRHSFSSVRIPLTPSSAAKTALLLDNTQLGSSQVQVSSAAGFDELTGSKGAQHGDDSTAEGDDLAQEDKPRSRIIAEYLAQGYVISDQAIQRALALDSKHGVSNRFTNALSNFDSKYKATEKAKTVDANYGITEKVQAGWRGLNSYFEKALGTPTGQRVHAFYTQGDKQVRDVHVEARRLADMKSGKSSGGDGEISKCKCGGDVERCECKGGECSCGSCPKNRNNMRQIPGTEKTTCSCGGDSGNCPCQAGKCACSGCQKSANTHVSSSTAGEHSSTGHSATGPAADIAASSYVAPIGQTIGAVPGKSTTSSGEHSATGPAADITASSGLAPVGQTIGAVPEKSGQY